jgi:hypothetical protein
MKRTFFLAALLAACGGSDDPKPDAAAGPHGEIACDTASWGAVPVGTTCERACEMKPVGYGSGAVDCQGSNSAEPGIHTDCRAAFTVDGLVGCCVADVGTTRFWECP